MKKSNTTYQADSHTLNVKEVFRKISRHWVYYLVAAVLFGGVAFVYLQVTEPVYMVSTTLLIHDNESRTNDTDDLMQDISSTGVSNLENEIGLLQSYNLVYETLKSLDFEVSYFEDGLFGMREKYHNTPFWVEIDTGSYQLRDVPMEIELLSMKGYRVKNEDLDVEQSCEFGKECSSEYFKFKVFRGFEQMPDKTDDYYVMINDMASLTEYYRSSLVISRKGYESTLLELTMYGNLPKKDLNFLNELSASITKRNLAEKNQIASSTINFINSQLADVSDSLKGAENRLETFKSREKVLDISTTASNATAKLASLESDQSDLEVKIKYYDYLLDYLQDSTDINSIVAPSSIGIADPLLNDLIIELKKLHNEKVALNYTRTAKSNELNLLNLQIENARKTIIENVQNIIESTKIALQETNSRMAEVRRVVNKLPENERDLMRIQRMFNLSDNLYNYLLQKRAEAGIAKASNQPDHKIIDEARIVGGQPISPEQPLVYLAAVLLTLVVPTLIILLKISFNDKITEPEQVESLTSVPVVGKIILQKGKGRPVLNAANSQLAESFRTLRVNLQYFVFQKDTGVIGVTSTVSGEGKTFCAYNLASIIAMTQKKVVLIEADMRKPSLNKQNNKLSYRVGLSNYLIGQAPYSEILQPSAIENMHIISSGPVPPNPVELLETQNFGNLINELKQQYDFVIIDSPPTGLVTDYMTILEHVDMSLYVARMDYSKADFLVELEKNYQRGKFKNLSLVLNGVKRNHTYGVNYGQYYRNGKPRKGKGQEILKV